MGSVKKEILSAGGTLAQYQVRQDKKYRIGFRADTEKNTEIKVIVYEGGVQQTP
ncbi:MAG: hypothetical protein ACI4EO_05940 [Blautia sp.]